ncbi:EAL domain-containing protein [Pseudoalteromonas sp. DY56-GL79]|uniref:EAL domain-containing protein n=1 Tax=Pseudoalteromonas sp. DY56-GL79 TaxID=2967131 RepID=UPI00352A3EBE
MFRLCFIFCICLFTALVNAAQISRLSPAEGLSQSYVNTLLIDEQGYLWLSTEGGLNRYDGYQVLDVNGPDGVLDKVQVNYIYQDNLGGIWITTGIAGLLRYDPMKDEYRKYIEPPSTEDEFYSNLVNIVLTKDDDHMWVVRTNDVAILNIHTGKLESEVTLPLDEESGFIRAVYQHQDILFIATSERLFAYHLTTKKLRPLDHLAPIAHPYQTNTKSLFILDQDTLLVGAVQGMYELDISQLLKDFDAEVPFKTLLPELNIWKMLRHDEHTLLLGTDKGLVYYTIEDGNAVRDKRLSTSVFLPSNTSVIDIVKDNYGGLWVATKEDGAFYLPDSTLAFDNVSDLTVEGEGFSHSNVWAMHESNQFLWLATNDGLTRYNPKTRETKQFLKGYLGDEILSEFIIWKIAEYNNKLWLTTVKGLFVFDPITHEVTRPKANNPEDKEILTSFVKGGELLADGKFYFVNSDIGMFVYDINTAELTHLTKSFENVDPFLTYGFYPPLPNEPLKPLYYYAGVLLQYDPQLETLTEIYKAPKANKHLAVDITTYTIDKNNILWLSLSSFGLIGLTLDGYEPIYNIDLKAHKIDTLMYEMRQDKEGMIWMSSHKGIWRLDPDNLHLQQFTTEDGILSNEFNGGASVMLEDGRIAYGMLKGFVVFSPDDNRPKKPLLDHVNITSVDLISRPNQKAGLKQFDHIELEHDDIGLEVSFSAMAFSYQDRIIYEYQISGGQKILSRNQNRVVFPKLNPGEYALKVWAKDPLTGDYTPPAKLTINVNYPAWRSPVAIAGYVFLTLLLLSLWSYRKYRVEQLILAAHKETQDREARLKMALEGSNSGVWEWHAGSTLIYQPRLVTELDYELESVGLDDYLQKIHPSDRAMFRLQWLEFVTTNKGFIDCTYRLKDSKGQWRWYKDFGKVLEWDEGNPTQVAGTYTNLTRERLFEERAALFGAAFEQTRDWVMILDKRLRIQACNRAMQNAFNLDSIPSSSTAVKLGMSRQKRMMYLRQTLALAVHQHLSSEEVVSLPNGDERDVLIKISAVANGDGELYSYVVVLTDISQQKRTEKELYQLANYDLQTKLPNKALLMDRVQHAIKQSQAQETHFALLVIKFNRLQNLYDIYGADFVAELLPLLATKLRCCFRELDSLATGHDKSFYVLMEHLDNPEKVHQYVECLVHSFSTPLEAAGHTVQMQPTIGIAMYPDDASDAFELNQAAKAALEHVNVQQISSYQFFREEMNGKVRRSREVEQALMRALKNGEFSNHYQPIVDVQSDTLLGFEALLRWPENSEFCAQEYALAAEHAGVVTELTLQTLSRALVELRHWQTIERDLYISINLSAIDFESSSLVDNIQQALSRSKVSGHSVAFEITETALLSNVDSAVKVMKEIKALGCRIYMDDFGTGYASLTYLQQLPIDVIKIDKSFVQQIAEDPESYLIIRSCVNLAHGLGLKCVAEGVENDLQYQRIKAEQVDYYQGYRFSSAISGEQVAQLLFETSL